MDNQSAHLFCLEGRSMNRLRDVRVLKRFSQMQLRLLTGVNQTKISWIENGFVKPKPEEKIKLARALGVSPEEIFPSGEK
jgi:transcriptional regulator with XRE-family HTH domain